MKFNVGDLFIAYAFNNKIRFTGTLLEVDELNDRYIIMWLAENKTTYQNGYTKVVLSINISAKHFQYFPVKIE